jgi:hypothetical protein
MLVWMSMSSCTKCPLRIHAVCPVEVHFVGSAPGLSTTVPLPW